MDRYEVGEFLRDLAFKVEGGAIPVDAVLVILSEADVHRIAWNGYKDWDILRNAIGDASDMRTERKLARGPAEKFKTPRERAMHRQKVKERADEIVRQSLAATPWVCICLDRFATERGRKMHIVRVRYGNHGIPEVA